MGESHGKESLVNISGSYAPYLVLVFGIALIIIAIKIPHIELLDEADLSQLSEEEREDIKSNAKYEIIK
jgi:hypothetical protein